MTEQTPAPAAPRRARRSRRPALLIAAGLVLVAMPVLWWLAGPRQPAGPQVPATGAEAAESLTGSTAASPPATVSPAPSQGPAGTPVAPVEIELPSLGLLVPVVPVGVEPDGLMEVPPDVRTAGWYRFGPAPGSPSGSAVLGGHVNDREQGPGVFARIGKLDVGQAVVVRLADGQVLRYRVVAREQWPKDRVPLARLFDRGGRPRLVLITCGGIFDRLSRNYQDNIAVTAVPA